MEGAGDCGGHQRLAAGAFVGFLAVNRISSLVPSMLTSALPALHGGDTDGLPPARAARRSRGPVPRHVTRRPPDRPRAAGDPSGAQQCGRGAAGEGTRGGGATGLAGGVRRLPGLRRPGRRRSRRPGRGRPLARPRRRRDRQLPGGLPAAPRGRVGESRGALGLHARHPPAPARRRRAGRRVAGPGPAPAGRRGRERGARLPAVPRDRPTHGDRPRGRHPGRTSDAGSRPPVRRRHPRRPGHVLRGAGAREAGARPRRGGAARRGDARRAVRSAQADVDGCDLLRAARRVPRAGRRPPGPGVDRGDAPLVLSAPGRLPLPGHLPRALGGRSSTCRARGSRPRPRRWVCAAT